MTNRLLLAGYLLAGIGIGWCVPVVWAHEESECPACAATPEEVAALQEELAACQKKNTPVIPTEQQAVIQQALDALNAAEQKGK